MCCLRLWSGPMGLKAVWLPRWAEAEKRQEEAQVYPISPLLVRLLPTVRLKVGEQNPLLAVSLSPNQTVELRQPSCPPEHVKSLFAESVQTQPKQRRQI